MWYLTVFLAAFAVDCIPVIGPPAWTVMTVLQSKFDLNIWAVLAIGVTGSALGRFVLSLYVPKISSRLVNHHKNADMKFLGKKLGQKLWRSWAFIFIYTLLPVPTTPLFTAAGMARMNPSIIVPPFFLGKFVSDGMMIVIGKHAANSFGDLVEGTFSWKSILTGLAGLLVLAALLFIDWRRLLEKKNSNSISKSGNDNRVDLPKIRNWGTRAARVRSGVAPEHWCDTNIGDEKQFV